MAVMGIIFGVAVLAIIVWDIWLAFKGGEQATLSWNMYMWSVKYPIVAAGFGFVVGLLMGHFFWNQCLDVVIGHGCKP